METLVCKKCNSVNVDRCYKNNIKTGKIVCYDCGKIYTEFSVKNFFQLILGCVVFCVLIIFLASLFKSANASYIQTFWGDVKGTLSDQTDLQTALDAKIDDVGSSTDNAVVTFDGTGGDVIQESPVTIDDEGNLTTYGFLSVGPTGDTFQTLLKFWRNGEQIGQMDNSGSNVRFKASKHVEALADNAFQIVNYLNDGFEINKDSELDLVGNTTLSSSFQTAIDHGSIAGLSDDDHSQYALLNGRSGGQTLIGGTDASDNLTLQSTSNATKGNLIFDGTTLNPLWDNSIADSLHRHSELVASDGSPDPALSVNAAGRVDVVSGQDLGTNLNLYSKATFIADGSIIANARGLVGGAKGSFLGVVVEDVALAFGGHFVSWDSSVNPDWLIGVTKNQADTTSLNYFSDSIAAKNVFSLSKTGNVGIGGWDADANPKLYVATGGNVGFSQPSPTAIAHIKGSTSDSSAYALKVDDSSNSNLLSVRNDGNVQVGGDTNIDGMLTQDGIFGGIHVHDASTAQAIATGTSYVKSTAFTDDDLSSNVTSDYANDKITVPEIGVYQIDATYSMSSGTANVALFGTIFLDGVEQDQCHFTHKLATVNSVESAGITCFVNVDSVDEDIDFRVRHDNGGSVDITISYANMHILYVGVVQ